MFLICFILFLIILLLFVRKSVQDFFSISNLTNVWCAAVTTKDVDGVMNIFDKNATLVGTVSQIIRRGHDIRGYFNYFCNQPGLKIIDKQDNIQEVNDNTWINVAYVTWKWDSLSSPIIARMTFVFHNNLLVHLHSSKLPELDTNLVEVSKKN